MGFFSAAQTDELVEWEAASNYATALAEEQKARQAYDEAERAYKTAWAEAVRGFDGVQAQPRQGSHAYTLFYPYEQADKRLKAATRVREEAAREAQEAASASGYRAGRAYFDSQILPLLRQVAEAMQGYEALRIEVRSRTSAALGELTVGPSRLTDQGVEDWAQNKYANGTFGDAGRSA